MTASNDNVERVRRIYDASAPRYDRLIRLPELLLFGSGRQWVTGLAAGRTLEVAAGTGRNLPHYPPEITLTALDVSEQMLEIARLRAARLGREVEFHVSDAHALPFADDSFDTVVATLALCSIPDDGAAVAEMSRVLRSGGRLVLLEHARSPLAAVRWVQRALEPLFLRLEGDHLLREPERRVQEAGLETEHLERSKLGIVLRLAARKPQLSVAVGESEGAAGVSALEDALPRDGDEQRSPVRRGDGHRLRLSTDLFACGPGPAGVGAGMDSAVGADPDRFLVPGDPREVRRTIG